MFPYLDGYLILGILRAEIRKRPRFGEPVFPRKGDRFRAPLFLELVGPFLRRAATEVELSETLFDRALNESPV